MNHSPDDPAATVLLHQVYANELRVHAVMLIWLGYRRMNVSSFAKSEEDDITGELIREMKIVAQDPDAPDWIDRYEIHEQTRQNVAGKRGKYRPIMDIEIERHHRGPRPCFGSEAKPLGDGTKKTIGRYLGEEGLAAFFSGYYPTTHGDAGMLGYVQEKTNDQWSAKLAKELSRNATKHRLVDGGSLQPFNVDAAMPAFRSDHTDDKGKPLTVIHVLLSFVG
jgi:hypothetical protein